MTEPENFEEDLFADLYADDEPAGKPSVPAVHSEPSPVAVPEVSQPAPDTSHASNSHGVGDTQMHEEYDEEEEDDDDVDFNLGDNSTGPKIATPSYHDAPAPAPAPAASAPPSNKGPNSKEDGKMFIGGLNWETTDQSLRDYFTQFGEVIECTVMRDGATGRSRGFGFLTFKDPKTVNVVMVKEHYLDGKIIDPKRAIPRDEQEKTSKIFVGGVSQETTDQEFKDYFAQFGRVVDATLMMDKDTGRPRGFGFVTFESEAGVDACLATDLEIHGKPIEVKKAQPRGNMREEEEANRRGGAAGKFRKGGHGDRMDDQGGDGQNQMGAAGGMTPQVMAQYWQRMQHYFAMMQQQMAMNRGMGGMAMNPQMMQMMQMQQMQQMQQMMGRGGGGGNNPMANMGQMNPQMMQQMQQMMAQQQGQGGGDGTGSDGGGFNQMDQQMFNQPQLQERMNSGPGNRRGGYNNQGGGGYGMGGAGGGGGAPPTSWEGMYDDVPQPNVNQGGGGGGRGGFRGRGGGHFHQQHQGPVDPNNAPPANAPTGPKNAGRPGANYRGGGRGGRAGFHPYAR